MAARTAEASEAEAEAEAEVSTLPMRLLKSVGDAFAGKPSGPGEVKLLPEHEEDLWSAYNLIVVGDFVSASTFRKVQRETTTGSTTSHRVKLTLGIEVRGLDFDPEGAELRLSGIVVGDGRGEVCACGPSS